MQEWQEENNSEHGNQQRYFYLGNVQVFIADDYEHQEESEEDIQEDVHQIDLHQMPYVEAMELVRKQVNVLVELKQDYIALGKRNKVQLIIITGRGRHSNRSLPVLQTNVKTLLQTHKMSYVIDSQTKGGQITVTIQDDTHMI
ncbi:Smr_domain-containing protein [Hexamita inflata]|uniref:Smr domain-containing protein n=1 Tax=Hexamita inflata TaxID=28002 RepID=A0AA86UG18_9EUKA|nr:Smr domain-containing protein [Hexamita inflata]